MVVIGSLIYLDVLLGIKKLLTYMKILKGGEGQQIFMKKN